MNCKYNIKEVIKSLDYARDYENRDAVQETLQYIVDRLNTQIEIFQNEMNYAERISHNWSDYEAARAVRNFCQEFLSELGIN